MKAIIKELGHMLEQICCIKRKHSVALNSSLRKRE